MSWLAALLRSYGQVLFARSWGTAVLLLLATLLGPGLHGLVAVGCATLAAWAVGLPATLREEGLFGVNALLVGLAVGSLGLPPLPGLLLTALGALVTVALTAAWRAASTVPPLTGPFLLTLWTVWGPAHQLGGQAAPGATGGLESVGGLLFTPHPAAVALVLVAALAWSRQGTVLAGAGAVVGLALASVLAPSVAPLAAVNGGLTAIAVGGVWFVPSWASLGVAVAAAAGATLATVGLSPVFAYLGLPLFILPFNLAAWTTLLAMRLRSADESPKAVDRIPGTPEENLDVWRTRVARFGARYWVRFRAPVLGTWTVTQSHEDGPTHRGPWSQAIDLEVRDAEGKLHKGAGRTLRDYLCYRLPVVAMADGTVAKVVDGVPDAPVGQVDVEHNWGNVVVVAHGPGLYSLVAHLAPGSIRVVEGQVVRRGDELGLCGSSGRSPRPHLHVQLQAGPEPGAPTLPFELHDVVEVGTDGPRVRSAWFPRTGDQLRNLDGDEDPLGWDPGCERAFVEGERRHVLKADVDLLGRRRLLDEEGGELVFHRSDDLITVLDVHAGRRSPLHVLAAALPRLPVDTARELAFTDHLSPRAVLAPPVRFLWDAVAPFAPWVGLQMAYQRTVEGSDQVITGVSADQRVRTRAVFRPGSGLLAVEHTVGATTRRLERSSESEP